MADRELSHITIIPPPIGLAAVEDSGRIVKSNSVMIRMIAANDGLTAPGGVLAANRRFELERLRKLIQDAAHAGAAAEHERSGVLLVGRPSGRRPYTVLVTPFGRAKPLALVLVSDPGKRSTDLGRRLTELYGLTPAEARAALGLAKGWSPKEIADRAGVGLPTVRTQVALLMKKMEVSRHADIVLSVLELETLLCSRHRLRAPVRPEVADLEA